MDKFSIPCTEEQTKKALELGAPIEVHDTFDSYDIKESNIFYKDKFIELPDDRLIERITAEQMIGFILDSGKGYAVDLAALIKEYGYKQGCLTFIDNYLK